MTCTSYTYASGDPLGKPSSYGYSRFVGPEFLAAWKRQRNGVLLELGGEPAAKEPSWTVTDCTGRPPHDAIALFSTLALNISEGPTRVNALASLGVLLKRFEVTKRVYAVYDQDLRAVDKDAYRDLNLYPAFAALLELAYTTTARLPFLNGLLKIIDTICAHRDKLDAGGQALTVWLILREACHVESLGRTAGAAN